MNRRKSSKKSSRLRTALVASMLACLGGIVVLSSSACSNQSEGERCDHLNGDDDCQTDKGLTCVEARNLVSSSSDRCCPTNRALATEAVCQTPITVVGNDAAAPADTGPPNTAEASVNNEASTTKPDAADASDAD